ncbi:MAG: glycosyltransferase [Rhodobacteraceae bacterium]|nr:glycosyltransferase [Paracoccaceae bacterium]
MEPLRVMHLHFGREGGAERFFVSLARALAERGVEQRFIIRPNRTWENDVAALGPVIQNNFSNLIRATGYVQLRRALWTRGWPPHAYMAWMLRASKLLPVKTDAVRVTRLGVFPKNLKPFGKTDVLVGNLPGIGDRIRALGWQRRLRIITNFPRQVTPIPVSRSIHDTPDGAFLVVAGGRFVPRKGFDVALRAIAQIDGAYLWLLGEGTEIDSLYQLAADLGIRDRVRFTGWVQEPIHALASGDAFLMPSRHEPLGNMLLDAWTAGIPSVSTRSEGPTWFMRDGIDGYMTDIDDVDAIARALCQLRDAPDQGQKFAANAKARLAEMFGKEAIVDTYIDLLSGQNGSG